MKPDTTMEALLGKIAQDEDCINTKAKPGTKMEQYLEKLGREFTAVPKTNPMNANGFLMSDGTDGPVWVKPLNVTFSGTTDGDDAACSATFEEIKSARAKNIPIVAAYDNESEFISLHLNVFNETGESQYYQYGCQYHLTNGGALEAPVEIRCTIFIDGTVNIAKSQPPK